MDACVLFWGGAAASRLYAPPPLAAPPPTALVLPCPPAAAHPEAEFFSTFYTSTQPRALFFDSKQSSHPLSVDPGGAAAAASARGLRRAGRIAAPLAIAKSTTHCACVQASPRLLIYCLHPLPAAQMNSTDVIESMFDAVSYDKGRWGGAG